MRQFSAVLLRRALGPVTDFFSSPRGRHSTFGRRRRSTRVRRYVPATLPAPEAVSAPVLRPAPPNQTIHAEEVALIRPYCAAHERERERVRKSRVTVPPPRGHQPVRVPASAEVEREFARVQARARALVQEWAAAPVPVGDLLCGSSEWDGPAGAARSGRRRQGVPA
ncbi:hypothetical protein A6A08_15530 [Nocardiopsis sp. TSRI0078]|uniref:hypothetical protein n=1 Tax=unclassified Nocardiopsis TaxID=2649073 RepID=UPI00093FB34B|nr:hypothetical protein [Nocardiopsis sp. TSRI0078]OKI13685.1 hypothetical protein A6A08_15530 [Nocardiopsis sp. TSRI0078]